MSKLLVSNQKENNITRKFYSDSYQLPENKINVQINKVKTLKKILKNITLYKIYPILFKNND